MNTPRDSFDGILDIPSSIKPQLTLWAREFLEASSQWEKLSQSVKPPHLMTKKDIRAFHRSFVQLARSVPSMRVDRSYPAKVQTVLATLRKFTEHDIQHLPPTPWYGDPESISVENLAQYYNSVLLFRDCLQAVSVFLAPELMPLESFDIGEVLMRNARKGQNRNDSLKSPGDMPTLPEDSEWNQIWQWEMYRNPDTGESIFESINFDFHIPDTPIMVSSGIRGPISMIVYNIIKNGGKMITRFASFDKTLAAIQREISQGITTISPEEVQKILIENEENKKFREVINRRGGKLVISGEVVDAGDAFVVHIWDNALGFDPTGIKNWIKYMAETDYASFLELCTNKLLSSELREGLSQWTENPHAFHLISANMSEFLKLQRFSQHGSSGMGLFGSEVLARKMGGTVLATESLEGGAFFSIVVPKDMNRWMKDRNNLTLKTQRGVASRALPILSPRFPQKAA